MYVHICIRMHVYISILYCMYVVQHFNKSIVLVGIFYSHFKLI